MTPRQRDGHHHHHHHHHPAALAAIFGPDLLTAIQVPLRGEDPDAERRVLAERLAAAAGWKRTPLERLRARVIRRLHQPGEDFAGVAALRTTEAALALVPRPEGVWAWGQDQSERVRRRWWRRQAAADSSRPVPAPG